MSAPTTPIVAAQILDRVAAGRSYRDIARELHMDHHTVAKRAKAMRPLIEAQALLYFEIMVPLATQLNHQCLLAAQKLYADYQDYPSLLVDCAPLLQQAHKISDRVLQSVGIVPSLAPSVVVQQFIQLNQVAILDAKLAAMFCPQSLQSLDAPEADDAVFEEVED